MALYNPYNWLPQSPFLQQNFTRVLISQWFGVGALGSPVVWIPMGIPENEKECYLLHPDSNPKPPGPKPPIYMQLYSWDN